MAKDVILCHVSILMTSLKIISIKIVSHMKSPMSVLLVSVTMLLTSCSENSVFETDANQKPIHQKSDLITFRVNSDSLSQELIQGNIRTRALPINKSNFYDRIDQFAVWSYFPDDGTYYIGSSEKGELVNNDGKGGWKNSFADVQWPERNLSFYAVAPYNETYSLSNGVLTYSVPKDQSKHIDLMTAEVKNMKQSEDGAVPLNFKHILAGLRFSAKVLGEGQYVDIKSITICNVNNNTIKINLKDGTYTLSSSNSYISWNSYKLGLRTPVSISSADGIVSLTDDDGVIFLPPQSIGAWDEEHIPTNNSQCYLDIECKERYKDYYIVGSEEQYGHLYKGFSATLKSGEVYNYCLNFNDGPFVDPGKSWNIKWCIYNLGADKATDNGDFFAWAEKNARNKNNYNFIGRNAPYFSSYNGHENDGSNLRSNYFTYTKYNSKDSKMKLESTDDAVTIKYGSGYRLPTLSELQKIGVKPGKRSFANGKSIYIPSNGRWDKKEHVTGNAYLWSSSRHSTEGLAYYNGGNAGGRETGMGIRPVQEK